MAGHQIATWATRVRILLGSLDELQITTESLEDHVAHAVRVFSSDRPQILTYDFAGDGATFDIPIASLVGWTVGFSYFDRIEYPAGQRVPVWLDRTELILYPSASAPTSLRMLVTTPVVGKNAKVSYAIPWPIPTSDPTMDLITDVDFEPVCALAAANGALELASRAAGVTNPTLAADSADWGGESARWMELYRQLKKIYDDHLGGDAPSAPASGVIDWDARAALDRSGNFLFRYRR